MKCQTPGCTGEVEPQEISHSVIYRERNVMVHKVPAEICPDCGDAVITEETTVYLVELLEGKAESEETEFAFER